MLPLYEMMAQNGQAVELMAGWARRQDIPGMQVDVIELEGDDGQGEVES